MCGAGSRGCPAQPRIRRCAFEPATRRCPRGARPAFGAPSVRVLCTNLSPRPAPRDRGRGAGRGTLAAHERSTDNAASEGVTAEPRRGRQPTGIPRRPPRRRAPQPRPRKRQRVQLDGRFGKGPPQRRLPRCPRLPSEDVRDSGEPRAPGLRVVGRVRGAHHHQEGRRVLSHRPAPLLQAQQLPVLRPPAEHVQLSQGAPQVGLARVPAPHVPPRPAPPPPHHQAQDQRRLRRLQPRQAAVSAHAEPAAGDDARPAADGQHHGAHGGALPRRRAPSRTRPPPSPRSTRSA